jgi:hypothetical protein
MYPNREQALAGREGQAHLAISGSTPHALQTGHGELLEDFGPPGICLRLKPQRVAYKAPGGPARHSVQRQPCARRRRALAPAHAGGDQVLIGAAVGTSPAGCRHREALARTDRNVAQGGHDGTPGCDRVAALSIAPVPGCHAENCATYAQFLVGARLRRVFSAYPPLSGVTRLRERDAHERQTARGIEKSHRGRSRGR